MSSAKKDDRSYTGEHTHTSEPDFGTVEAYSHGDEMDRQNKRPMEYDEGEGGDGYSPAAAYGVENVMPRVSRRFSRFWRSLNNWLICSCLSPRYLSLHHVDTCLPTPTHSYSLLLTPTNLHPAKSLQNMLPWRLFHIAPQTSPDPLFADEIHAQPPTHLDHHHERSLWRGDYFLLQPDRKHCI